MGSDFDHESAIAIAELLAPDRLDIAASVRAAPTGDDASAVLSERLQDAELLTYFDWASRPADCREWMQDLRSYPSAMSWDWWQDFLEEVDGLDPGETNERFLERAGDACLSAGTALITIDSGSDGGDFGFTPASNVQRVVAIPNLHVVKTGWQDSKSGHSADIREWARQNAHKVTEPSS
ncbi:DUF6630 family protein [Nocardia tengchongensis]|uniref:DUF6630 family protein n=1 Tax=Nocardia tengchongensis TaxID=2055889 RepID=UPI00368AEB34